VTSHSPFEHPFYDVHCNYALNDPSAIWAENTLPEAFKILHPFSNLKRWLVEFFTWLFKKVSMYKFRRDMKILTTLTAILLGVNILIGGLNAYEQHKTLDAISELRAEILEYRNNTQGSDRLVSEINVHDTSDPGSD
jgi:hypothetical protein